MSGAQFAELLVDHVAQELGVRASGVGVIKKNPDQVRALRMRMRFDCN
jgi:hypothetical protein